jgi:AcrR family transcriptional regulator
MRSKAFNAASTPLTQAERLRQSSRQRREQQRETLRRTILDAAGELFLEFGYEGFSLRQVAERIGYSATTIYRYFANKDDLLFSIIREAFIQFGRELNAAAHSTDDPLARIEALGHAYINFGLQNPVHYQLMFMQRTDFLLVNRKGQERPMIDSFTVLQEAVQQAMDAGAIERGEAEIYSEVFWALVHGITSLAVAKSPRFTRERMRKSVSVAMRMMRQGLRAE